MASSPEEMSGVRPFSQSVEGTWTWGEKPSGIPQNFAPWEHTWRYSSENFSKKIIKICDNEGNAYENEMKEISKVNADTNPMYYNIAFGGKGGVKGINVSDETKEKRRIANSGKNHFHHIGQ